MENNYNENSIKALGQVEAIRMRPASIGIPNENHTFIEILANAIDEHKEGYGNVIRITKHNDKSVSVQDFGRGVPLDINDEGVYNYDLVFNKLWAGGKYSNNEEGGNYLYSLGTNGIGATGTNYVSDFLNCTSYRNGYKYYVEFIKGINNGGFRKSEVVAQITGTTVRWKPSKEVFGNDDIDSNFIIDTLNQQAIVNGGLKFEFHDENTNREHSVYYENGIIDFIDELNDGKNFTDIKYFETECDGRETEDTEIYKAKIQLAFCFNNEINYLRYFHNSSWLENGGTPETAVKQAFTYGVDKYLKDNGKYNKGEKKITFDDICDSLILITSTFSTVPLYTDQTKKTIKSKFLQQYMSDYIKHQLEIYFIENKNEAEKITTQCLINMRARKKSENNRQKIRKELESEVGNALTRPSKYVPCRSKDRTKKRLTIIEGDSALNAIKLSRDREFDGILPLKGKPINCLKKSIDEIINNEEIKTIVKLLGCGVTYKGKSVKGLPKFNIDNIQYSEINIISDGDEDGFHIRCLAIGIFYMLMPDVIKEEMLNIVEAPLYRLTYNKKDYICYDEIEKNKILETIGNKNVIETRFKGLGGLNTNLSANTIMSMENRRIKKVTMVDAVQCVKVLEMFLDDDSTERKQFIKDYGYKYFDFSIYED